jgi:hypothetical protein
MAKNSEKTIGPTEVQVFELTMDNDEDQEELNRRLCKPGESERSASVKPVTPADSREKEDIQG